MLVKFAQKGRYSDVFYIGEVIDIYDQRDFDLKFLRKFNTRFVFPLIEDISQISRKDIICTLKKPKISPGTTRTSSFYLFEEKFDEYNMR